MAPLIVAPIVYANAKNQAQEEYENCMKARGYVIQSETDQSEPVPVTYVSKPPAVAPLDIATLGERVKTEQAKQWIKYGSTNRASFYYDPISLNTSGEHPTVREQIAFLPGIAGIGYAWRSTEVDCGNSAVRFTDFVASIRKEFPQTRKERKGSGSPSRKNR